MTIHAVPSAVVTCQREAVEETYIRPRSDFVAGLAVMRETQGQVIWSLIVVVLVAGVTIGRNRRVDSGGVATDAGQSIVATGEREK